MKCALTVALFRLFTIGVLTDGNEIMESVLVKDGDSVTLKSGLNKRHINDGIEWKFNGKRIIKISGGSTRIQDKSDGSFRGKLKLDEQSGDLKISNIRTTEAGQYKPEISSPDGTTLDVTFTVNVVPDTEVKPVPVTVMEGDSVNLLPDLTDIQTYGEIQWRFRGKTFPVSSLTITDITAQHTGLYEADITSSSRRYIIHKTFNVTISGKDAVKLVSKKKGESVHLQTDTKIQNYELIQWIFGNNIIVEMNKTSEQLFKGPDKTFRDRLELDHQTGSLTITDTRTTDSGHYTWSCKSSRYIIDRTINVYVVGPDPGPHPASHPGPDPSLSPAAVTAVGVALLLVGVAVGFVLRMIVYKKSGQSRQRENGENRIYQNAEDPNNEETVLPTNS